jgi:predicted permease
MSFWDWMFHRRQREEELDEEVHAHLRMAAQVRMEQGETAEQARASAIREFGNVTLVKEVTREMWGFRWLETLLQDLRCGARQLRRNPGFTAVSVLTLALGIGANTAIFSLLDAVMLRSLPVRDPEDMVVLKWTARHSPNHLDYSAFDTCYDDGTHPGASGCSFSYPVFKEFRSQPHIFSSVTAIAGPVQLELAGNGTARMVGGEIVSGEFFQTLGVPAALGRVLEPADDTPSAEPVAVLNYACWRGAFGADPSVVGKTIRLNGVPFTVVGVSALQFNRLIPGRIYDLWLPISASRRLNISWVDDSSANSDSYWWLEVIARSRPNVSTAQAQAALTLLFRDEMAHDSKVHLTAADNPAVRLVPAQKALIGIREQTSKPLAVLMLAVGILLLIACANVTGLMLARASGRQKEMAVRLALGATRRRVVRQLLTESVLVSTAGGALGVCFAYWGAHSLAAFVSTGGLWPLNFEVQPDTRVLAFTAAVSILAGLLFGLAPALRSTRLDLMPALKGTVGNLSSVSQTGIRRLRLGSGLVVAQVALSVLVLAGAGLLVRTLANLKNLDPGFDTRKLLLFGIDPTLSGYNHAKVQSLYRSLEDRLRSLPGVIAVSYSSDTLLSSDNSINDVRVEGRSDKSSVQVNMLSVGPNFLETMHISLLTGRTLNQADLDSTQAVAVVNRAFVKQYLEGRNPLGLHFGDTSPKAPQWQILGVMGDAKYSDLRDAVKPTAYVPLKGGGAHFELRTVVNAASLIPAVRRVVGEVDSNLPLFSVRTQSEQIDGLLFNERLVARLSSLFGLLALLLACVGIYGLLAYEVAQRTREIGIRMALGAQQQDVLRLVITQAGLLILAGVTLGLAAAAGVTRYLGALLYGVRPIDPVTFAAVVLLLATVAMGACLIPARRATKIDPMVALRYE